MRKVIFIVLAFFSLQIFAQDATKKLGAWYAYSGNHKLSDKWALKSVAEYRTFEALNLSEMQVVVSRLGANYTFNKSLNITAGYGYFELDSHYKQAKGTLKEHRFYIDVNNSFAITKKIKFTHRFRPEFRFRNLSPLHQVRFKPALHYSINNKWTLCIADEVFFKHKGKAYMMQWLEGKLSYKLNNTLKLNLGYIKDIRTTQKFDRISIGITLNTNHQKQNK